MCQWASQLPTPASSWGLVPGDSSGACASGTGAPVHFRHAAAVRPTAHVHRPGSMSTPPPEEDARTTFRAVPRRPRAPRHVLCSLASSTCLGGTMQNDHAGLIDEGTRAVWSLLAAARGDGSRAIHGATVRFLGEPGPGVMSVLEVEHGGSPSALDEVREALFNLRVQVVRAAVPPRGSFVQHFCVAEFDGARIGKRRREQVWTTLMTVLSSRPTSTT